HHKSQDTAVKQKEPPPCVSCHGVEFDVREFSRPRLQAAYHGMCLKCHENMKLEKPKKCTDCHERKLKTNVYN
ncbi:MAG: cytochrome c3 family protein, partial [Thermodesulfovibrio sp.]|nr:cytochrome c3 family protein [Thermodesulfovibrio sp.]